MRALRTPEEITPTAALRAAKRGRKLIIFGPLREDWILVRIIKYQSGRESPGRYLRGLPGLAEIRA